MIGKKQTKTIDDTFTGVSYNYAVNINRIIGQGHFGTVYSGLKKDTQQIIAVKIIQQKRIPKRQIQIMQYLSSIKHSNIVSCYSSETVGSQVYFFLQYCPTTLQNKIRQKSFDQYQVLILFKQLLGALSFIHALNILHRDLKPANILISREGNIKIADFGLSKINQIHNTMGTGTPKYKAPEVSVGDYDMKCDIWSLGLIVYQMLKRQYIFPSVKTQYSLKTRFRELINQSFDFKLDSVDPLWAGMIRKMLTYDKNKRITSKQLLDQFQQIQSIMSDRIKAKLQIKLWNRQESFENLISLRNYWNFRLAKNNLYKQINLYLFDVKGGIQKKKRMHFFHQLQNCLYILAILLQYKTNLDLEQQTHKNILILPNSSFHTKNLLPNDQLKIREIKKKIIESIKQQNQYLVSQIRKPIKILLKNPLPQQSPYTKVIEFGNSIINNTNIEIRQVKQLYIDLLLLPQNRRSEEDIREMRSPVLRIYFLMHAVIHLPEFIEDQYYNNSFYLINKKEQLHNFKKEQMIQKLREWTKDIGEVKQQG